MGTLKYQAIDSSPDLPSNKSRHTGWAKCSCGLIQGWNSCLPSWGQDFSLPNCTFLASAELSMWRNAFLTQTEAWFSLLAGPG